jgi:hypothetical protein
MYKGVLKALCPHDTSSTLFYPDVQRIVDVTDLSIHTSLAVFTSILIGTLIQIYSNGFRYFKIFDHFSPSLFFVGGFCCECCSPFVDDSQQRYRKSLLC